MIKRGFSLLDNNNNAVNKINKTSNRERVEELLKNNYNIKTFKHTNNYLKEDYNLNSIKINRNKFNSKIAYIQDDNYDNKINTNVNAEDVKNSYNNTTEKVCQESDKKIYYENCLSILNKYYDIDNTNIELEKNLGLKHDISKTEIVSQSSDIYKLKYLQYFSMEFPSFVLEENRRSIVDNSLIKDGETNDIDYVDNKYFNSSNKYGYFPQIDLFYFINNNSIILWDSKKLNMSFYKIDNIQYSIIDLALIVPKLNFLNEKNVYIEESDDNILYYLLILTKKNLMFYSITLNKEVNIFNGTIYNEDNINNSAILKNNTYANEDTTTSHNEIERNKKYIISKSKYTIDLKEYSCEMLEVNINSRIFIGCKDNTLLEIYYYIEYSKFFGVKHIVSLKKILKNKFFNKIIPKIFWDCGNNIIKKIVFDDSRNFMYVLIHKINEQIEINNENQNINQILDSKIIIFDLGIFGNADAKPIFEITQSQISCFIEDKLERNLLKNKCNNYKQDYDNNRNEIFILNDIFKIEKKLSNKLSLLIITDTGNRVYMVCNYDEIDVCDYNFFLKMKELQNFKLTNYVKEKINNLNIQNKSQYDIINKEVSLIYQNNFSYNYYRPNIQFYKENKKLSNLQDKYEEDINQYNYYNKYLFEFFVSEVYEPKYVKLIKEINSNCKIDKNANNYLASNNSLSNKSIDIIKYMYIDSELMLLINDSYNNQIIIESLEPLTSNKNEKLVKEKNTFKSETSNVVNDFKNNKNYILDQTVLNNINNFSELPIEEAATFAKFYCKNMYNNNNENNLFIQIYKQRPKIIFDNWNHNLINIYSKHEYQDKYLINDIKYFNDNLSDKSLPYNKYTNISNSINNNKLSLNNISVFNNNTFIQNGYYQDAVELNNNPSYNCLFFFQYQYFFYPQEYILLSSYGISYILKQRPIDILYSILTRYDKNYNSIELKNNRLNYSQIKRNNNEFLDSNYNLDNNEKFNIISNNDSNLDIEIYNFIEDYGYCETAYMMLCISCSPNYTFIIPLVSDNNSKNLELIEEHNNKNTMDLAFDLLLNLYTIICTQSKTLYESINFNLQDNLAEYNILKQNKNNNYALNNEFDQLKEDIKINTTNEDYNIIANPYNIEKENQSINYLSYAINMYISRVIRIILDEKLFKFDVVDNKSKENYSTFTNTNSKTINSLICNNNKFSSNTLNLFDKMFDFFINAENDLNNISFFKNINSINLDNYISFIDYLYNIKYTLNNSCHINFEENRKNNSEEENSDDKNNNNNNINIFKKLINYFTSYNINDNNVYLNPLSPLIPKCIYANYSSSELDSLIKLLNNLKDVLKTNITAINNIYKKQSSYESNLDTKNSLKKYENNVYNHIDAKYDTNISYLNMFSKDFSKEVKISLDLIDIYIEHLNFVKILTNSNYNNSNSSNKYLMFSDVNTNEEMFLLSLSFRDIINYDNNNNNSFQLNNKTYKNYKIEFLINKYLDATVFENSEFIDCYNSSNNYENFKKLVLSLNEKCPTIFPENLKELLYANYILKVSQFLIDRNFCYKDQGKDQSILKDNLILDKLINEINSDNKTNNLDNKEDYFYKYSLLESAVDVICQNILNINIESVVSMLSKIGSLNCILKVCIFKIKKLNDINYLNKQNIFDKANFFSNEKPEYVYERNNLDINTSINFDNKKLSKEELEYINYEVKVSLYILLKIINEINYRVKTLEEAIEKNNYEEILVYDSINYNLMFLRNSNTQEFPCYLIPLFVNKKEAIHSIVNKYTLNVINNDTKNYNNSLFLEYLNNKDVINSNYIKDYVNKLIKWKSTIIQTILRTDEKLIIEVLLRYIINDTNSNISSDINEILQIKSDYLEEYLNNYYNNNPLNLTIVKYLYNYYNKTDSKNYSKIIILLNILTFYQQDQTDVINKNKNNILTLDQRKFYCKKSLLIIEENEKYAFIDNEDNINKSINNISSNALLNDKNYKIKLQYTLDVLAIQTDLKLYINNLLKINSEDKIIFDMLNADLNNIEYNILTLIDLFELAYSTYSAYTCAISISVLLVKYNYILDYEGYSSIFKNIYEGEKEINSLKLLSNIKNCHEDYISKILLTNEDTNIDSSAMIYYLTNLFDVNYNFFNKFAEYNNCNSFKDIINDKEITINLLDAIRNKQNNKINNFNNKIINKIHLLESVFPIFSIIKLIENNNYKLNLLENTFKSYYYAKGNIIKNKSLNKTNSDNASNLSAQTDFNAFFNTYINNQNFNIIINNNSNDNNSNNNKNNVDLQNIYNNDLNPFWLSSYFIDKLQVSPFILFQIYWSTIKNLILEEKYNQISHFLVVTVYIIYRIIINVELYYNKKNTILNNSYNNNSYDIISNSTYSNTLLNLSNNLSNIKLDYCLFENNSILISMFFNYYYEYFNNIHNNVLIILNNKEAYIDFGNFVNKAFEKKKAKIINNHHKNYLNNKTLNSSNNIIKSDINTTYKYCSKFLYNILIKIIILILANNSRFNTANKTTCIESTLSNCCFDANKYVNNNINNKFNNRSFNNSDLVNIKSIKRNKFKNVFHNDYNDMEQNFDK